MYTQFLNCSCATYYAADRSPAPSRSDKQLRNILLKKAAMRAYLCNDWPASAAQVWLQVCNSNSNKFPRICKLHFYKYNGCVSYMHAARLLHRTLIFFSNAVKASFIKRARFYYEYEKARNIINQV